MEKSHRENDAQKKFSSKSSNLEMATTEGMSSSFECNIGNSSSSTEDSLKASLGEEPSTSSELRLAKSRKQLLENYFGNEKPSTSSKIKTSSYTKDFFAPSSSTANLLNTLETGVEKPSSSAIEPVEIFVKETPSSSSDFNPSSSTEELSKIFQDKTSRRSYEVTSSSAEELPQIQENQIPSAKQLTKLQAKGRMTALPKEISSSSDNDKPSSSSDDVFRVDENFSDRKETRTLPPFLKRNSRRSPEFWKYTKRIPTRVYAVPPDTESEMISSSTLNTTSAQNQCDNFFASLNLGRNADTRNTAPKRKSTATKNAYAPNNRCSTSGADPGVSSPQIIKRYRNKRLLAARKRFLQSKMESNRSDLVKSTENPQAETAAQSKEMVAKQQEEDKNENPKKTQQQINYEIMNQQVLDFFSKIQDHAEEDIQQPAPRGQQNQDDDEDN